MKLKTTKIFEKNYKSNKRIVINRGGSSSSKTYSLIQLMVLKALTEKNKRIIIVRSSLQLCKKTILKELVEYLNNNKLYNYFVYNKTNSVLVCRRTASTIEFVGADDAQKFRGLSANYFWFEEATEIGFEFFKQSNLRLRRKCDDDKRNQFFLSFNPSDSFSWIKNIEETYDDVDVIVSTYRDNPFLNKDTIKQIERLKVDDYDSYLVYGEGKYGEVKGAILRNWKMCDSFPEECKKVCYGLDFGFSNDPSALVKIGELHGELYIQELLYNKGMTNQDLSEYLKEIGLTIEDEIYADSAEPKSIEEIKRSGFNIRPTKKGPDSIKIGIDILKRYKLNIVKPGNNLRQELINYKWKVVNDIITKKPVDDFNHCFHKDTLISTNKGQIKISELKGDELIKTRFGYKKILSSGVVGYKKLYIYHLTSNTGEKFKLICTPDHLIKIKDKLWKQVKELKNGQTIYLDKSLMEKNTHYTKEKNISQEVENIYTEKFGNTLMVKYKKDIIYTIKMVIKRIMKLKILKSWKEKNTCQNILKNYIKIKNIIKKFVKILKYKEKKQKNGINQKKVKNGIESMLLKQDLDIKHLERKNVKFVEKNMKLKNKHRDFVQINVNQNIEEIQKWMKSSDFANLVEKNLQQTNTQKENFVTTVDINNIECEFYSYDYVYDISVDDIPEYFANGILVHNCIDSIRYCVLMKYGLNQNNVQYIIM